MKWHSASSAAKLIGIGRRSLDRATDLGALPCYAHNGQRLYEEVSLLAFRVKLIQIALDEGLVVRKDDGRAVA